MSTPTRILRRAVALALLGATLAQAQCPPAAERALLERFIPADCEACWQRADAPADGVFVLDWIVPSARGDEAPLSPAALPEASARAGSIPAAATTSRPYTLPAVTGLVLRVEDGPAWNGYIGLRLLVQSSGASLPAEAAGFLALVDEVPAGDEGSPVARRLVRVLAGPLTLDAARPSTEHLMALRIPLGARIDRLAAVGWVESAPGRPVVLARAVSGECAQAR